MTELVIEAVKSREPVYPNLHDVPICVDLDGTLIQTDLLSEGLVAVATSRQCFSRIPQLLATSRAGFKHRVARIAAIDVSLLPYNRPLLTYLTEQKALGRKLILATAADRLVAQAVADHLELFDEVIASDGEHNLKGEAKARALVERFGDKGFIYAGNDTADLPVWRAAGCAVVVNASRAVQAKVDRSVIVEARFESRPPIWRAALLAMRPHQWAKNALVFVPLIMAHAVTDLVGWAEACAMFLAFCITASSIYLINDLSDLAADRQHPRKRHRPLASGALPLGVGAVMAGLLLSLGFGISLTVGGGLIIVVYAIASISYSLVFKELPLVDVFILTALYTIRVLGGGVATGHRASLWLLAFSGFLFLGLAFIKRTEEMTTIARSGGSRTVARRGYLPGDAGILQTFGCAATFSSSVVLALFVGSDAASARYVSPELLWGIVPFMLFWQCRLWLSTARGHMHDDPIVYTSHDWVSWIVACFILALIAAATIGVPFSFVETNTL